MHAPSGKRVLVATLSALINAQCGNSPTMPSDSGQFLPVISETPNYILRASSGDTINGTWQEVYHAWVTTTLGVTPARKITFNKYTSRSHMQAVVGVGNTNAYADRHAYAIHTIWPTDNHEVVHLFTSTWGDTVALVNEGVAVAFQVDPSRDLIPRWSGSALHDLARQFKQQGRSVPLAAIVETASWRSHDPNVVYPMSGSFMRWLIDRYGLDRLRALYARGAGPNEPADGVRSSFATVYGMSLEQLEAAWIVVLTE